MCRSAGRGLGGVSVEQAPICVSHRSKRVSTEISAHLPSSFEDVVPVMKLSVGCDFLSALPSNRSSAIFIVAIFIGGRPPTMRNLAHR